MSFTGSAIGRLAALALLQVGISGAFMLYFTRLFDYGERVIVFHVCVVAAILGGVTIALALFKALLPSRISSVAIRIIPAMGFVLTAVLYGADLLSNRFWGHNVTYELTGRYVVLPLVLARYVTVVGGWGIVIGAALVGTAGAVTLVRRPVVVDGLAALLDAVRCRRTRAVALGLMSLCAVLPFAAAVAVAQSVGPAARQAIMERDPVVGFFIDGASAHQFALSRVATRFREEGPAVRAHYPSGRTFDRRNVILIVVDSLRADHMDTYGYARPTTPFLRRMVEQGALQQVEMALASCPESNCGISSIMASKTFGSMVPENFKLHELLRDQGYASYFVLSGDHTWIGLRQFYGNEIDVYFDGHSSRRYEPTDDRVLFEGLEHVPDFTDRPAFMFFHLMSAHEVGFRLDPFVIYSPSRPNGFWGGDREMRVNSYDNGVRQADAFIEQLFDALGAKGYLDHALVVITSDHGEGLGERPGERGFGHGGLLYQEFLRIPLLVLDQGPYANLEYATHVDIAPTIVQRLGLAVPASWEGRSLLVPGLKPYSFHYVDRSLSVHAQVPYYAVVRPATDGTFKYIRQRDSEELFNLTTDPREQENLVGGRQTDLLRDLRSRLAEVLALATP